MTAKKSTKQVRKGAAKKSVKRASTKRKKNAEVKPLPPRREKFIDSYLANGGNGKKAAEDAGFAPGHSAEVEASRLLRNAEVRRRINERLAEAEIDPKEVIGTLVSHLRVDIADIATNDPFIQAAKAAGVSHLIKEYDARNGKVKVVDSFAAAKQLCVIFGLEKLPATNPETLEQAIEKLIEKAAAKGLTVTAEQARAKLQPLFATKGESSQAIN